MTSPLPSDHVGPRLLLVDDEPHITHVLSRRFTCRGYSVRVAREGREALTVVASWRPDLIISDLQMPGLDGLSFAERVAERPESRGTPIIMISGRGFLLDSERVKRTSIAEVLEKPFSAEAVMELADRLLRGRDLGTTQGRDQAAA
jgi:CheY-like chemotaxis protein